MQYFCLMELIPSIRTLCFDKVWLLPIYNWKIWKSSTNITNLFFEIDGKICGCKYEKMVWFVYLFDVHFLGGMDNEPWTKLNNGVEMESNIYSISIKIQWN